MRALVVLATAFAATSAAAAPATPSYSFLEAFPLNPGPVEPGRAPRQFMLNFFNDQYLCERTSAVPSSRPAPVATPTAAPQPVQIFCDGSRRIVARRDQRVLVGDEFSWSSDCKKAVEEFRQNQGCFCGAENTIRCLTRDFTLASIGGGFSLRSDCVQSLKEMSKSAEIKLRD